MTAGACQVQWQSSGKTAAMSLTKRSGNGLSGSAEKTAPLPPAKKSAKKKSPGSLLINGVSTALSADEYSWEPVRLVFDGAQSC